MERLTRRMCGGYGMTPGHELSTVHGMREAVDRLAAYEDTGLEPEEVRHWKECIVTPTMKHLVEMCGKIEAERDRYKKAEADGRLEVLPCAPGAEVWVVDRDEDGYAVDVYGYMFLAKAGDAVILTPYINDLDNAQDILAYHMNETTENYETNLMVFPAYDCYTTREKAEEAMEQEAEDE